MSRAHVLAAMAEYDRDGSREFLRRYGFSRARAYTVWHNGQEYDARAIVGAAYVAATGRPPSPDGFANGEDGAARVLKGLGFDVVELEQPVAPPRARAAGGGRATSGGSRDTGEPKPRAAGNARAVSKPRKAAAPPAPVKLCPHCHVAVPASGICDFCD